MKRSGTNPGSGVKARCGAIRLNSFYTQQASLYNLQAETLEQSCFPSHRKKDGLYLENCIQREIINSHLLLTRHLKISEKKSTGDRAERIGPEGEAVSGTGREEEAQRFRELKPFSLRNPKRKPEGKESQANKSAGWMPWH